MKKIFTAILIIAMLCSTMAPVCLATDNDGYWKIIAEPASSGVVVGNTTGISGNIAALQLLAILKSLLVVSGL